MNRAALSISATAHGLERQRQRGIGDDQLDFTLRYGTRRWSRGAILVYLRWRDIPAWVDEAYAARVHATVAVLSPDGALLTTYRNPNTLRRLKKRPRWSGRH